MGSQQVELYVYDLSQGMARQLSPMLLGRQLDGIWHTGVVVHGTEYYYGGGIQRAQPGSTPFGAPVQRLRLGQTEVPKEILEEYLQEVSSVFSPQAYSLLHHNCNTFSNELAAFLTGTGIPAHITGLPAEVMATPFGQMIAPMLTQMETQLGNVRQQQQQAGTPPVWGTPAQQPSWRPAQATPAQPAPQRAAGMATPAAGIPNMAVAREAGRAAQGQAGTAAPGMQPFTPAPAPNANGIAATPTITPATQILGTPAMPPPPAKAAPSKPAEAAAPSTSKTSVARKLNTSDSQARAKALFEAAVKAEYAKILAAGAMSNAEAAALAVQRVKEKLVK